MNEKPKNIIFCFGQKWNNKKGGASSFELSILREVLLLKNDKSFKYTLVTSILNKKMLEKLDIDNFNIRYYLSKKFSKLKSFKFLPQLSVHTLINALKPDYVICIGPYYLNTNYNYSSIIWDLAHLTSVRHFPEIIANNGINKRNEKINLICSTASHLFVGTSSLANDIKNHYSFPICNIIINRMPLDRSYLEDTKNSKRKNNLIFYPAQLWPHKNHKRLLTSFCRLLKNKKIENSWKMIFVGSDVVNFGKDLKDFVKSQSIENNVEFKGFVSDEELKYLYKSCHAMIFTSLLGADNIPPLEGLSQQILMSISNLPGHIEQTDNQCHYHDPNSVESIEEAILFLAKKTYPEDMKLYNLQNINSASNYLNNLLNNAKEVINL